MRLIIVSLFAFQFGLTGNTQYSSQVTEDDIYNFINKAIFNDGDRTVIRDSIRIDYYSDWNCYNKDSTVANSFDCMIIEFMKDTLRYFIDSSDILFFKEQLSKRKLLVWNDEKLSNNVKVKSKKSFMTADYYLPLFSRDKKTVIMGVPGVLGFRIYHWNTMLGSWEMVDYIRTGT